MEHVFNIGDDAWFVRRMPNDTGWVNDMNNALGTVVEIVEKSRQDGVTKYRFKSIKCYSHWWANAGSFEPIVKEGAPKKKAPKRVVPPKIKSAQEVMQGLMAKEPIPDAVSSFVYQEGNVVKEYFRYICHAPIMRSYRGSPITAVVDNLQRAYLVHGKEGSAALKRWTRYANFIIRRSPWKNIFKIRIAGTALKQGMPYDCSQPHSAIMGGITALRSGTEYPDNIRFFIELLGKGYSEHTAYIASAFIAKGADGTYRPSGGGNHSALGTQHTLGGLVRFMKEGYYLEGFDQPMNKGLVDRAQVQDAICTGKGKMDMGSMIEKIQTIQVGEGWRRVTKRCPKSVYKDYVEVISKAMGDKKGEA